MNGNVNAPLAALRAAEAQLVDRINEATDAVASVGTGAIGAALDRLNAECAAARARLAAARQSMTQTLADLLGDITALTGDIGAGLVR